jgi:hypothetical protein
MPVKNHTLKRVAAVSSIASMRQTCQVWCLVALAAFLAAGRMQELALFFAMYRIRILLCLCVSAAPVLGANMHLILVNNTAGNVLDTTAARRNAKLVCFACRRCLFRRFAAWLLLPRWLGR